MNQITPDLRINIAAIELKNPVLTASGTFGYGLEYGHLIDLNKLGGIVAKGLSLEPSAGNPPPRIVETACGMLNAIGLENVGLEVFLSEKLPPLARYQTPVFVNIYGKQISEYAELAARLDDQSAVAGIEINISCPNVSSGGIVFGVDPEASRRVVAAVRARTTKPLIVKLSPNVTDIAAMALVVQDEGADAVSLINTITGMAIDIEQRRPKLANITGGLSGPAIKPVAVRMVWQVAQKVSIPVIGIGGIMTAQDAIEFLLAGATAVQIGTANFVNPRTAIEVIAGIENYLKAHRFTAVGDIVGGLEV